MSEADKTEKPTPKRLREATRDGDVLQSRDLATAIGVAVGVMWLVAAGAMLVRALSAMMNTLLTISFVQFSPARAFAEAFRAVARPVGLLLALTVCAALVAPTLLGSVAFRASAMTPKWSRIDPWSGMSRIFGTQGFTELGKSLAKVGLIGGVCGVVLYAKRWQLIGLAAGYPVAGSAQVALVFVQVLTTSAAMLILVAVIDVPLQIVKRSKRLGMTRDEVTRENREAEGSPELKRERRSRQYALATMSARSAMKEANVVLVNPTHFAVALRYRPDSDIAPVVVARGVDAAAAAIRDLAKGNFVPCLEYPALARALYFTSKAGDRVQEDLYFAVASVLAFVMNLDAALAAGRTQPDIDLPPDMHFGTDGRRNA
jgi:flagellar biosynthesis protein FlhB